jgi:very-short-patch-repair endonuclease
MMSESGPEQAASANQAAVDGAVRLFTFLGQAASLRSTPVSLADNYDSVLWLNRFPVHPAVTLAYRGGDPGPEDPIATIERIARLAPPAVPLTLLSWLSGAVNDPSQPPSLRDSVTVASTGTEPVVDIETAASPEISAEPAYLLLADHPAVQEEYNGWLARWESWAEAERANEPVRELYRELFAIQVKSSGSAEDLELVLGVGCLSWSPAGHSAVKRHLFTVPLIIGLDEQTGRLSVRRGEGVEGLKVEVDMLDPGLLKAKNLSEVRTRALEMPEHPLHRDAAGALARSLVFTMDADGSYDDGDFPAAIAAQAAGAFAPAIILRKRSQQGIVEIFRTIVAQLLATGQVPDGVIPFVDPDHRPQSIPDGQPGASVLVDDDLFLPLPVNDVQRRIIQHVDRHAQTLVQGPPGTGKTHTAAALLSHLLAQGKRVLVTAHTDRALKEVRDKLPAAFKPLSVSIVGSSREDMSDLKIAVERIAAMAAEHDPQGAADAVSEHLAAIDELRRKRSGLYRQLIEARAEDVRENQIGGLTGTQAAIARQHGETAPALDWLSGYVTVPAEAPAPFAGAEITAWRSGLLDAQLAADAPEAGQRLVDPATIPTPDDFTRLAGAEARAEADHARYADHRAYPAFAAISRLDQPARQELQRNLLSLADATESLSRRPESWIPQASADVRSGRGAIWQARARNIQELIEQAGAELHKLGQLAQVSVAVADYGPLVLQAQALHGYLAVERALKTSANGMPKIGLLTSPVVKQAQPLFDHVRVNGAPPVTQAQLENFLSWVAVTKAIDALDRAWPTGTVIPPEDTLHERWQWHRTELEQLTKVQRFGETLTREQARLAQSGLPAPDWNDVRSIRGYAALIDAANAAETLRLASQPVLGLAAQISQTAQWADASPAVAQLLQAIQRRDGNGYDAAYRRLIRLALVRKRLDESALFAGRFNAAMPLLRQAIADDPAAESWVPRLASFEQAWQWASVQTWLHSQHPADVNVLQAEIHEVERAIHRQVEELAAIRAWSHAVAPGRLTGKARADLAQYADLVRGLGKGTGKYAVQKRADIRHAMDRCRSSVPVWIMPIYRIAEQLNIQPNMFDVVVVDEASQAGLEATFLQYLAPKIVVIGDDKQISPAAVGVDQQQLRSLALQHIPDDRYRASWQNPQRSLFDEARMRFSGLLTLVEHRRCVPEIIGFSNRIAYEPDGIRLLPVRQYGADRLDPIKPVLVEGGYVRGTTNKVNPPEVDAIVDQIEKCLADPRYDGLTFGVISLLGKTQASAIEKKLLERIPPAEWAARELRCGDSADFQGSERDVMFLSMVAAPEPGKPMTAQTRDDAVKRYNVAASRAKDQMWLFHSVALTDLGNPDDMRFLLLDYCYGVVARQNAEVAPAIASGVPHDRIVPPFDSLFEQRVYNRLVDRGFTVVPQYPVHPYRIDLVVTGAKTRLAIECDGDFWHGPEAYERDLARQRDLERCGWKFFRLRESAFYVDEAAAMAELWAVLSELEIHPSGWTPPGTQKPQDLTDTLNLAESLPAAETALAAALDPTMPLDLAATPDPAATQDLGATAEDATVDLEKTAKVELPEQPEVQDHDSKLPVYTEFRGTLPPVTEAEGPGLEQGVLAIVEAEGPVLGERIHTAYARACGATRVTKTLTGPLNSAISAAVRSGLLIEENPLDEAGVKPRTYRLPDQPSVRTRRLGPRPLEHVPPAELAALLSEASAASGGDDQEAILRATLDLLGLKRLTKNVTAQLTACLGLVT